MKLLKQIWKILGGGTGPPAPMGATAMFNIIVVRNSSSSCSSNSCSSSSCSSSNSSSSSSGISSSSNIFQMMVCTTFAVALLVVIRTVTGELEWDKKPKWGFQFALGSDGKLECNDSYAMLRNGDKVTWVPPSLNRTIEGSSGLDNEKYTLIDKNFVRGMILKIKSINEDDHGVYICWVKRKNVLYTKILRAVNLHSPEYSSMIVKYSSNFMIGGITAIGFVIIFSSLCSIDLCKEDQENEEYLDQYDYTTQATGYDTQATGYETQAIGYETQATENKIQATGYVTQATLYDTQATLYDTQATGYDTQATGYDTQATGYDTQATGYNTQATGYVYENKAAVYDNQAAVYDNQAAVYDNQAAVYDNQAAGYEKQATGNEKQEAVYEKQATGYEKQATGNEKQAAGYEKQATGNEKQAAVYEKQAAVYEKQATGNEKQEAGYETQQREEAAGLQPYSEYQQQG